MPPTISRTSRPEVTTVASPERSIRCTPSEAALLSVLTRASSAPCTAWLLLADQLGARDVGAVLACAEAVATAFADAGRPIADAE